MICQLKQRVGARQSPNLVRSKAMIQVKNKRNYRGTGIYIGRPSPLGNPFVIGKDGSRKEVIHKYREWLEATLKHAHKNDITLQELVRLLRVYQENGELTLICWCDPQPCHGDVLASIIEDMAKDTRFQYQTQ